MKIPFYYWISVFFYSLVIFFANFGETQLISFNPLGFGFWFVILLFAASLGFIISFLFGLRKSLWILGIVYLVISFLIIILVILKPEIFVLENNLIPIVLKQVLKSGLSSIFGLLGVLIWQSIYLSKELIRADEKIKFYEKNLLDAKREAEILKKDAEVKANEMIFEAKKKVQELEKFKRDLEMKIREFLQIELSILDKHEESLKD